MLDTRSKPRFEFARSQATEVRSTAIPGMEQGLELDAGRNVARVCKLLERPILYDDAKPLGYMVLEVLIVHPTDSVRPHDEL